MSPESILKQMSQKIFYSRCHKKYFRAVVTKEYFTHFPFKQDTDKLVLVLDTLPTQWLMFVMEFWLNTEERGNEDEKSGKIYEFIKQLPLLHS